MTCARGWEKEKKRKGSASEQGTQNRFWSLPHLVLTGPVVRARSVIKVGELHLGELFGHGRGRGRRENPQVGGDSESPRRHGPQSRWACCLHREQRVRPTASCYGNWCLLRPEPSGPRSLADARLNSPLALALGGRGQGRAVNPLLRQRFPLGGTFLSSVTAPDSECRNPMLRDFPRHRWGINQPSWGMYLPNGKKEELVGFVWIPRIVFQRCWV